MFETKSRLLTEDMLSQITKELVDNTSIEGLSDNDTMCLYIPLPKEIQTEFNKQYENYNNKPDTSHVWCEYWIDEGTCHYVFHAEGETYAVTDDFSCEYLNTLIVEKYRNEYGER